MGVCACVHDADEAQEIDDGLALVRESASREKPKNTNIFLDIENQFKEVISHLQGIHPNIIAKRAELGDFSFTEQPIGQSVVLKFNIDVGSETKYYGFWDTRLKKAVYKGVIVFPDGALYEGHIDNGFPNGLGRLITASVDVYYGNFKNGKKEGKGRINYVCGGYYEGDCVNGVPNGFGLEQDKSGRIYEGEFKQGKKCGRGILTFPNKEEYVGDFLDDKYHGYGVIQYLKNERYEGEWQSGKKSGMGTFWYHDQSKYTGTWLEDRREGRGKLLLPNGDIYDGNWTSDHLEEKALFFTPEKGWSMSSPQN